MIQELFDIIKDRKTSPLKNSYTSKLFSAGQDEILKKVGEEAVEVILAAKGQGNERLVEEVSDLIYHTLVLLVNNNVALSEVEAELARRHQAGKQS